MTPNVFSFLIVGAGALVLTACATTGNETRFASGANTSVVQPSPEALQATFEADRQAILAMAGEYSVTFDFREYLPIEEGYEIQSPKSTPAREVVYVIEDTGEYISLQHLLLVGPEMSPVVVKHWRQDWTYEPTRLLSFQGFGRFDMVDIDAQDASGAWSQTVYQVDDSPRYAGLARWEHGPNAATWEPEASYRPLPRRDATIRDDYDAIEAVNRHTVTAWGWTHEQDNSKVVLREGEPFELVREHGINTYVRTDLRGDHAAARYWDATQDYWAEIRAEWTTLMATSDVIVAEDDADGTLLYMPVLMAAQAIIDENKSLDEALADAAQVLQAQVTVDGTQAEVR